MSSTYQRLFVNGFEKTNNTNTVINTYSSPTLQLQGTNRLVHEIVFYNHDMVGYDFEKSATDQLTAFSRVDASKICFFKCQNNNDNTQS